MTTSQLREKFVNTFAKVPIMMLQGSVGERIKRNFTHQDPQPPLKLAGLYYTQEGHRGLDTVFHDYVRIARQYRLPMILHPYSKFTTPAMGKGTYWEDRNVTEDNLNHCRSIVDGYPSIRDQIFIGSTLGFYGDPYKPQTGKEEQEAYLYYINHAKMLEKSIVDHARNGLTPCLPDAAGCARALSETSLPYFITFLIRKDGKLMDGTWLNDAIDYIDAKTGDHPPMFYQVNCVHPRNVMSALDKPQNRTKLVRERFLGLEANGSDLSPEDLDNSPVIYSSPADEWADDMMRLHREYGLKLLGGCCGTDHDHIEQLAMRVRQVYDEFAESAVTFGK